MSMVRSSLARRGQQRSTTRAGFTLVELLIVVVIIGILAGTALPSFSSTKGSAAEATLRSDVRNAVASLESYYMRNGNTYVGATQANANIVNSPGNALTLSGLSATDATIKFANASANRNCTQTIGSAAAALACADGP